MKLILAVGWLMASLATVPSVVGDDILTAKTKIADAGLALGSGVYEHSRLPRNTVIRQSPAGGSQVAKTAVVNLVISDGADQPKEQPKP